MGWSTFGKHYQIMNDSLPLSIKRKVYNSCILPVLALIAKVGLVGGSCLGCKNSSGSRKTCSFCPEKRKNRYVQCKSCVVYKLPLSCGGVYIGQTGRCINVRLREHLTSLTAAGGLHLPAHCRVCGCQPMADEATCLFGHRDKCTREVMEAFFIEREGERCVSKPSVALGEKEVRYLGSALSC
uniref:Tick transposon n=1 Tax=Rhipicephalus zambeziensis TaxID=60191 RepID=A0A224Z1G1_9ACAR